MPEPIYHMIPDGPTPVAPYCHLVEFNGMLFITGQLATDLDLDAPMPESIEEQTHKTLDNLRRALATAGAGFENVLFVRIYLTKFDEHFDRMNAVYRTYFPEGRLPGRTTVGVTGLAAGGDVEIDMIAYRPG
ncbi:RidA family protein [Zavarzinia sp. CC-PAN008]|uniref:RidA family protein n=1 Tax=Zavarzinia sp. CC-PAN008 TaxID=3243332 RepID=UPI003F74796D